MELIKFLEVYINEVADLLLFGRATEGQIGSFKDFGLIDIVGDEANEIALVLQINNDLANLGTI